MVGKVWTLSLAGNTEDGDVVIASPGKKCSSRGSPGLKPGHWLLCIQQRCPPRMAATGPLLNGLTMKSNAQPSQDNGGVTLFGDHPIGGLFCSEGSTHLGLSLPHLCPLDMINVLLCP